MPSNAIARFLRAPDASDGNSLSSAIDNRLVVLPPCRIASADSAESSPRAPSSVVAAAVPAFARVVVRAVARSSALTRCVTFAATERAHSRTRRASAARARRSIVDRIRCRSRISIIVR